KIFDHEGCLDGIARLSAEDVAFGGGDGGRHGCSCRAGDDQGQLGLLEHVQRTQGDTGVAEADGRNDTLLHQFFRTLATHVGGALVVLDHQLQRTPEIAADGVDFLD
ncbi:hypothetical protein RZS08_48110, partial [Arthrospira platensis SPKY1]|nr:hypothetical protein [Arthrospira platensis SPKY1]